MENIQNISLDFVVDKFKVIELDNSQLTKVEIYVCHDKRNKNGSYISLENMVRAQNSILRKPLLYRMNSTGQDFLEHEQELYACGFVDPIHNGMRYEEIDGITYFIISCIVWNVYMQKVLQIFNRDGEKKISMEAQVSKSSMHEDGFIELIDYKYLGLVLLGDNYETGMYNTSAKISNFSKNDLDKKIEESEDILKYALKESYKEEEQMAEKIETKEVEKVKNSEVEVTETVIVEEFVEEVTEEPTEEVTEEPTEEAEVVEEAKAEFSSDEVVEPIVEAIKVDTQEKDKAIFALDNKIKDLEKQLESKDLEIEELAKFKKEKDIEARETEATELFSRLSKILDKQEIEDWKSKESNYENFKEFDKDISKFAVDKILENLENIDEKKQTFSRIHVEDVMRDEKVKPKGIWEVVEESLGESIK